MVTAGETSRGCTAEPLKFDTKGKAARDKVPYRFFV